MERQALSILVENTPNVLSHVSGLFSRRGYNIDSISAGVTADPRFTRITIVSSGDELILEQIEKQLAKLEDVVDIKKLENGSSVCRELILIKIRVKNTERQAVISLAEIFKTKIVDVTNDSMMIELIGTAGGLRDTGTGKNRHYRAYQRLFGCENVRLNAGTGTEKQVRTASALQFIVQMRYYKYFRRIKKWQKYFTRKTVTFLY